MEWVCREGREREGLSDMDGMVREVPRVME